MRSLRVPAYLCALCTAFVVMSPPAMGHAGAASTVAWFVYDRSAGESIIGAAVSVTGTTSGRRARAGALTNNEGSFVIPEAPAGKDTLTVSYTGYSQIDTAITVGEKPRGFLRFFLVQSSYGIGEVVVT